MTHTYELLQNGGYFTILIDLTIIEDEPLIRMIENEIINIFINDNNWNVINKKENAWSYTVKTKKIKYKYIKVLESDYNKSLQLLKENDIKIKIKE